MQQATWGEAEYFISADEVDYKLFESFGHDAESSLQISWRVVRVIFYTLGLSAILFLVTCE